MKICWDNLEKIKYRPERDDWQDKFWKFYIYKESRRNCGEPFLTQKGSKGAFCDSSCAMSGENHIFYGKSLSEEHKEKLSISKNGKNNSFYGKKHSKKTIKKMSKSHEGFEHSEETKIKMKKSNSRDGMIGEANPNWKGGISCEPYCDVWLDKGFKESIKERDGNQCLNPACSKENKTLLVIAKQMLIESGINLFMVK